MDRKEFFKKACSYGACTCAGLVLSPAALLANDSTPENKEEDFRIGFIQERMAKFIEGMDNKLDEETSTALLENMGRQCAQGNHKKAEQYKGNLKGYLKSIAPYVDKAELDEEKGTIKIVGVVNNSCFCPFVDISKMPKEFCNCTKGWQKETYEAIIGKPVEVIIDESVLRGSNRCAFTISYTI